MLTEYDGMVDEVRYGVARLRCKEGHWKTPGVGARLAVYDVLGYRSTVERP